MLPKTMLMLSMLPMLPAGEPEWETMLMLSMLPMLPAGEPEWESMLVSYRR